MGFLRCTAWEQCKGLEAVVREVERGGGWGWQCPFLLVNVQVIGVLEAAPGA